ncbi:MAG: RHS repeat protein, partial [Proteobacteria bacterium]|nr:RHS repeat protein [Pseudomonadota bacterium]
HRLTDITDGSGNKIHYTLDAMGNRTAENTYDPSNALHRTHSRVYNNVNQLYQDINAAGTAATTTLGYDPNGNQTTTAAPLSRNSTNAYDELNRLKQITDPGNGVTQFGYDANDNLTQVTDPRSLVTSYTYTGFGDLKTQTSPDTGLTAHTFDSGGNLKTRTDARGALATYSYDALNRVTQVAYTDQTISFSYDAGTYGKGRLTGAGDANHSMSWTYDAQGRVTGKGQTVGTVTKSIGYGYSNGNPVTMSLPSGQLVTYQYNANHQVTGITLGTGTPVTLLSNITYEPFGPVKSWTWGNSTTMSRTYDADGRVTSMASGGVLSLNPIVYDEASRITGITDTKTSTNSWSYGYDAMDRLSSASKSGTSYGWTYDANGNRKTQTGTSATTYTISTTSNRLTNLSGATTRTYGFDASGNITSYDSWSFTYNKRNRMSGATSGANSTSYVYNALGQMIRKSGSATGLMMYDEAGHLVGEYTSTGTLTQETIWLGDTPVATIRPNGTSYDIYYVHTDQIDTPRMVSRPSDNKLRWRWDLSSPFGGGAANENPASLGAFSYNLRFPGQILTSETGNKQNGFRVYESFTGRYVQSDPIGLQGGINTYAYVGSEPTILA